MSSFRLLSIDGGGIRGLIPALILAELEKRLEKPLCELFDVIAGTSTGGILALGLSVAERPNAAQLVELYKTRGTTIFPRTHFDQFVQALRERVPFFDRLREAFELPPDVDPRDLFEPKYGAKGRREALADFFRDRTLNDARTRVFVTSYDTDGRTPVFFVRNQSDILLPNTAASSPAPNDYFYRAVGDGCSMVDAAMATSAAPTYFPPHKLEKTAEHEAFCLVDGGVFANNPTGLAQGFLGTGPSHEDDLVVSLGTGSMEQAYKCDKIRGWGAVRWAIPVLKMMLDGQTEAVALLMQKRVPPSQYFRFQGFLTEVSDNLDDVSEKNIAEMERLAESMIEKHDAQIDDLCAKLAKRRDVAK